MLATGTTLRLDATVIKDTSLKSSSTEREGDGEKFSCLPNSSQFKIFLMKKSDLYDSFLIAIKE